jgi:hypothetical protein
LPKACWKRRAVSVGSGAAPLITQRSDEVSYLRFTSSGKADNRRSIVGTAKAQVTRSFSISASVASGSKWSIRTTLAPSENIIATKAGAALW